MDFFGWGKGEDKKREDDRRERSPSKDGHSHNTRGGGQPRDRDQRHQGQTAMDVTDSYSTSSSAIGAGVQQGGYSGHQHTHAHDGHSDHARQHYPEQMSHGTGQQQSQRHIFRNAQASKQMVYEVYGNTMAMLEEVEAREMAKQRLKPLPRSDIHLPSQHKYDDSTSRLRSSTSLPMASQNRSVLSIHFCIRKLETQLLLFQSQLTSCDKEIRGEVHQELTEKTVMWNSIREHKQVPKGVTDTYVGKLIEVLTQGKTEHPREFYEKPKMSEVEMKGAMQGIMEGQHRRAALDDDYRKNPDKKAHPPNLRSADLIDLGAERVSRNDPHLSGHMGQYNNSIR